MTDRYAAGKTGEDLILQYVFLDADEVEFEISAATITVKNPATGALVVDDATVTAIVGDGTVQYRWVPGTAADYEVEWHGVYGDAIDVFSGTIAIRVDARIGTSAELAGTDTPTPTLLPWLHLPGIYTLPSGSDDGDLVAITAAGVADAFATRAAGAPIAAQAVILTKLTATTGRLAAVATLDIYSGLTAGSPLYVGTAGALSHTQATTAGELDQLVGFALTTTTAALWTTMNRAVVVVLGQPAATNKAMAASLTAADFALACATAIVSTPDGYVAVMVGGMQVELGDGVRTKDCYFSGDGGTTARAISAIVAGDMLYWVGSVAGYELATTDRVDFNYEV